MLMVGIYTSFLKCQLLLISIKSCKGVLALKRINMSLHSISEYFDDMARRRKNQDYLKLPTRDNGFVDAQFQCPAQNIPWKAISLATLLLVIGTSLLVFGALAASGRINLEHSDRLWPMIIIGIIMFIPGAYHVRIAYYAYKEVPGYSFDDIPEFE